MKTKIEGGTSFSYIHVDLDPGDCIIAESDAMASMHADIDMKARFNGGFFSAWMKKIFGGESLFVNTFTNRTKNPRRVTLVQPTPGEIKEVQLKNSTIYLQGGAYVASTPGVKLGVKWAGFASWIGGEGLFKLQVSGTGSVFFGAYGSLLFKEVDGEYIVDSNHLVAYEPQIKLKVKLAGGLFSSFFGGEGLVTRVVGKGKIVIQTRSVNGLKDWINPRLYG